MTVQNASSGICSHAFARVLVIAAATTLASCGTLPVAKNDGHLSGTPSPAGSATGGAGGNVPQPVRDIPLPPPPKPRVDEMKYSVTVKDVPVQELMFAISRDTKVNIDIHPGIEGRVTLNALDQTLKQILTRVSKQVDMRWEVDGPNIVVRPDSPYLKLYVVDYINMSRESTGSIGVQTQVVGPSTALSGSSGGQNSAILKLENKVKNDFWTTLEKNIRDILLEEDKFVERKRLVLRDQRRADQVANNFVEARGTGAAASTISNGQTNFNRTTGSAPNETRETGSDTSVGGSAAGIGNQTVQGAAQAAQASERQSSLAGQELKESNPVIVNRETGTISVRANSKIHEKIAEFINHLIGASRRQVLVEATVVEVVLNDKYQSGVDWSALGLQNLGYSFRQNFTGANLQESPFFSLQYRNPNAAAGGDISSTVRLLNSFGNSKVLSSPKIMTLNNQTAVMRVVENRVYFTIQSQVTAGNQNQSPIVTYTTIPNVVPEGFVMNVTPQVGENDIINLNVRPSVTRITGYVNDPNPDLAKTNVISRIPLVQTREFETMLRVASGQTAVLGGLMQDSFSANRDGLPILARLPIIGDAVSYRNDTGGKSELVVFLRATVIRDASVDTDLAGFKRYLPNGEFFQDASPSLDPSKAFPSPNGKPVPESKPGP